MRPARSQDKQIIGIMADSHGQAACIQDALDFFERNDCSCIYHLGDICDSAHPETAEACVQLLLQHHIQAIKGNNDHQVVVNHVDRHPADISVETIEFLQRLPLTSEMDDMVLAHSLPFIKQRGLSSMVGALGDNEAALFFRLNPHKILVRGHSHLPELVQSDRDNIVTTKLIPEEIQTITDIIPGIITCGAVDHGYVMIWDRQKRTIFSDNFRL